MKKINWTTMSELGLVERINREIMHPLGLAVTRDVSTGSSDVIHVADDGFFEYCGSEPKGKILSKDEIHKIIGESFNERN